MQCFDCDDIFIHDFLLSLQMTSYVDYSSGTSIRKFSFEILLPNLAPCDFFLSPKIKFRTQGNFQKKTTKLLRHLTEEEQLHCFDQQKWFGPECHGVELQRGNILRRKIIEM